MAYRKTVLNVLFFVKSQNISGISIKANGGENPLQNAMRENHFLRHFIKKQSFVFSSVLNGGGIGIRTLGTLARTTVFKTAPINHSGIPPIVSIGHLSIVHKTYFVVKSRI